MLANRFKSRSCRPVQFIAALILLISLVGVLNLMSPAVQAAPAAGGAAASKTKSCDPVTQATCAHCASSADGSTPAGCPSCSSNGCDEAANADPHAACNNHQCDFIRQYVNPAINLLSAVFGFIAVISIITGGIQYSASGGDPQKVAQAKARISKTIVAVVAYMYLFAFLQFIIPGGIFK